MNHSGVLPLFLRWIKFSSAGGLGIPVHVGALWLLRGALGWHYLTATAAAVELAILHNFFWHHHWTWEDRKPAGWIGIGERFFRYNVSTGAVSIISNLVLMRVLCGHLGMHYAPASLLSIAMTNLANFALCEWLVFRAAVGPGGDRSRGEPAAWRPRLR